VRWSEYCPSQLAYPHGTDSTPIQEETKIRNREMHGKSNGSLQHEVGQSCEPLHARLRRGTTPCRYEYKDVTICLSTLPLCLRLRSRPAFVLTWILPAHSHRIPRPFSSLPKAMSFLASKGRMTYTAILGPVVLLPRTCKSQYLRDLFLALA
jgi:hypothetical protein